MPDEIRKDNLINRLHAFQELFRLCQSLRPHLNVQFTQSLVDPSVQFVEAVGIHNGFDEFHVGPPQ